MVFILESEVFFICSAIVFKVFQCEPTKYFFTKHEKKILFHVDLIKMLSVISLFLRFLSYFPQNSGLQKYMAYMYTFSSYQVVSQLSNTYLPLHQMRTELGLLKRPVLLATNTVGALQQIQTEISSLTFGRTHWARNFVCFFSFRLLSVLPGFVYKRRRLDLVFCCCCYFPSLRY